MENKELKAGDTLTIIGKRWFQSSYGNTYFTAEILVNGDTVAKLPFQYGGGDHYVDMAFKALQKLNLINDMQPLQSGWRYCNEKNIKLVYRATDVSRKKDL